jgi:uncharacterized Tic20 family protein
MITSNEKNTATLLHLSALSQYLFPLGNYIFPVIIWSAKKNESEFIDNNGKSVLNFQLSILIYSIILCIIAIPILIYAIFKNLPVNITLENEDFFIKSFCHGQFNSWAIIGIIAASLFFFIKIVEFVLITIAAVKASNGECYKYPLSIPFFK